MATTTPTTGRPRKLGEVLASQSQHFTQAEKVRTDLMVTFEKKRHLFTETLVTYKPDEAGRPEVTEEQSALQSTVASELRWLIGILAPALDSEASIDEGNTRARSNILLDNGTAILENVPTTQIMQLDKRLGELLSFVQSIPTLDPAAGYTPDPDRGHGVSVARVVQKRRTRKEQVPIVLLAPTVEHPGVAQLITKDVEIGSIEERRWSGLVTPATKATMLERVEELRRAVKQARSRANDVVIEDVKVGDTLLRYIFGPAIA